MKLKWNLSPPVLLALASDASVGLANSVGEAMDAHRGLLSAFRESDTCAQGVLYVRQTLFSDRVHHLHPWVPLDPSGGDHVAQLTPANYRPAGPSAFYDAVYEVLCETGREAHQVRQAGFVPRVCVVVITAGVENASTLVRTHGLAAAGEMILGKVSELRDREWLQSAILMGLSADSSSAAQLEDTRRCFGFSSCLVLRSPSDVRRLLRRI